MLSYSELLPKKVIILEEEPYEVLSTSGVVKKQRQKPHNTAKMRNLKTGSVVERTFTQADKIEEADIEKRAAKFIYSRNLPARGAQAGHEWWFCDPTNPKDRFSLSADIVGPAGKFLATNAEVALVVFDDTVLRVEIPIKVDLKVTEAPPAVRGNTSQGATKLVVLESGATVTTPLFINEGDVVRVNTETGEYVERA